MVDGGQDEVVCTLWGFGWARTVLRGEEVLEADVFEGAVPDAERAAATAWWDEGAQVGSGGGLTLAVARATGRWWEGAPPPCAVLGTPFQNTVWRAVCDVPAGEVTTYAALASAMGQPRAARAVARALAANRVALWIPCHRVGPAGSGVGGFRWGPRMKAALRAYEASAAPPVR